MKIGDIIQDNDPSSACRLLVSTDDMLHVCHFPNPAIGVLTKIGHLTGVVLRWGAAPIRRPSGIG